MYAVAEKTLNAAAEAAFSSGDMCQMWFITPPFTAFQGLPTLRATTFVALEFQCYTNNLQHKVLLFDIITTNARGRIYLCKCTTAFGLQIKLCYFSFQDNTLQFRPKLNFKILSVICLSNRFRVPRHGGWGLRPTRTVQDTDQTQTVCRRGSVLARNGSKNDRRDNKIREGTRKTTERHGWNIAEVLVQF